MSHVRSLYFGGPLAEIGKKTLEAYQARRPSEIIWNLTSSCNLYCKHCYVNADHHRSPRELSTDEALDVVRQIGEAQVPLLFLTGGEPLLRPDFWKILEKTQDYGIKVVLSSHGLFIDDEAARKLKTNHVDYVALSIYGPEPFHDAYVGQPGAYKKVRTNIQRMKDQGIRVGVKTTVNEETFPYFFDLVDQAKEMGAGLVYACDLIAAGRATPLNARRVPAEAWYKIADYLVDDVLSTPNGGLEYDLGANPSVAMVIEELLRDRGANTENGRARLRIKSACPVGRGLMGINADGDVLPCSFVQDYTIGNIRDLGVRGAADALFGMAEAPLSGTCGSCEVAPLCRGCRVKAYQECQDIFGSDPSCLYHSWKAQKGSEAR